MADIKNQNKILISRMFINDSMTPCNTPLNFINYPMKFNTVSMLKFKFMNEYNAKLVTKIRIFANSWLAC